LDQPSGDRGQGRTLDVLVAGAALPPNPSELIESHAMEALLEEANSMYDLVVVDTTPLAAVSDAFPLLRKVDGIIIVGRVGRNRRDVAERLHETLAGVGAPLLGVIANGLKSSRSGSYGYGYGYDYSSPRTEPPSPEVSAEAPANGTPAGAFPWDRPAVARPTGDTTSSHGEAINAPWVVGDLPVEDVD